MYFLVYLSLIKSPSAQTVPEQRDDYTENLSQLAKLGNANFHFLPILIWIGTTTRKSCAPGRQRYFGSCSLGCFLILFDDQMHSKTLYINLHVKGETSSCCVIQYTSMGFIYLSLRPIAHDAKTLWAMKFISNTFRTCISFYRSDDRPSFEHSNARGCSLTPARS